MDNNSCGFHISSREMDIEDDFNSRNSITSLLNSAAASAPSNDGGEGGGGGGGGGRADNIFESIATYLDNMNPNPRAPLAEARQLLIRKGTGGPGGVDPQEVQTKNNIDTSTTASTTTSALNAETVSGAPYSGVGGGAPTEQSLDTPAASQWRQQQQQNSSGMATSRGGCGAPNGSGSGNGNGSCGRLSLDSAAASKVGKKRSRASRRAPTTVLTTDTSNFRAMVQEFTGIPPAPFASTSPFSRSRLDFLAGGARSLTGPNPFLLRPFPQRMAAGAQGFASSAAAAPNFPVPQQSPPNLLFQSLLQPGGPSLLNKTSSATTAPLCNNNNNMILEELGLNPPLNAHVLPDLVPSDRRSSQWADGAGACKMSYSKATGDLGRPRTLNLDDTIANTVDPGRRPHHHHDNNNNNIHARGADRMVDSWISSSDQTLDKLVQ